MVTRHGEQVVVVIAADAYRKSHAEQPDFAEFLLSGPHFDDLDLERSREPPRDIDFGE